MEIIVCCSCVKEAKTRGLVPSSIFDKIRFEEAGYAFLESDNEEDKLQFKILLQKHCSHPDQDIIHIYTSRMLPSILYFIEQKLPSQIEALHILQREFFKQGYAKHVISPDEFQELKNEIGILWSSWVKELDENEEVEIWINQLELALVEAEKRQHPIILQ